MYYVLYSLPDALDNGLKLFEAERIEPAIDFAMALHRSCNVENYITVVLHHDKLCDVLPDENVLTLSYMRKENPRKE